MPTWLKCSISIFGLLVASGYSIKVKDPKVIEVFFVLGQLAFILGIIFLPWVF